MSNQTNPYPEVSNERLLNNQSPVHQHQGYTQGYQPPNNYQQRTSLLT